MTLEPKVPEGFDLESKPRVAILAETTIPPVSRANIRMYWLAKALIADYRFMVNMISPSHNLKTQKSYFTEWIRMNQFPSFKLFEYRGCGKPVVCTKLEAIDKFMKNENNGLIMEDGEVGAFADCFLKLIEDKELAQKIGSNGRELVEREFDWTEIMKREVICYEDETL